MEICSYLKENSKYFQKVQQGSYRQLNELKKIIHKENNKFNERIKIIKKQKWGQKNMMNDMKNAIKSFNSRINHTEERICEGEGRSNLLILSRE